MRSLFGPVVPVELITSARRRRHYVVRVLFALAFLLALWSHYTAFFDSTARSTTEIANQAEFAREFFNIFVIVQLVAVLLLTPAYVAPALVDEKERRTLDYLLTTDLRSREIVLGKLAVRVGHLLLYVSAAVPIFYLATWFGGISFEVLGQAYALTLFSIIGVACASMLLSVYTRKVREALAGTYAAVALLLVFPPMLEALIFTPAPWRRAALRDTLLHHINEALLHCDPLWVWLRAMPGPGGGPGWDAVGLFALYVGLFSLPALLWCVLMLRRVYLRQTYGPVKRVSARSGRRRRAALPAIVAALGLVELACDIEHLQRPPLGRHPVMWRELTTSAMRFRWAKMVAALLGAVVLAWYGWYALRLAFPELGGGYLTYSVEDRESIREEFNIFLRTAGTMIALLILLIVSVHAATSVSGERERQTWDTVLATRLEPREIVWGKFVGAVYAPRWLAALLLVGWLIGVLSAALHPLALVALTIELTIYTVFLAALGIRCSLSMRRSGSALATVLGTAFFFGGGYLMCCAPVMITADGGLFFLGASYPTVLGMSAFRTEELRRFLNGSAYSHDELMGLAFGTAIMLVVYLVTAVGLLGICIADFDRLTGRPTSSARAAVSGRNAFAPRGRSAPQAPPPQTGLRGDAGTASR